MTRSVKLNYEDRYDIKSLTADLSIYSFYVQLSDGRTKNIRVEIKPEKFDNLGNVYNLSFGPLKSDGQMNTRFITDPADHSRLFSTIFFYAGAYLKEYPERYIGMDLHDEVVLKNFDFLTQHFNMYGVKYFIRFKSQDERGPVDNPFDFDDIFPVVVPIRKGQQELFNYYLFQLADHKPALAEWEEAMGYAKQVGRRARVEDFSLQVSSLQQIIRSRAQAERFLVQLGRKVME